MSTNRVKSSVDTSRRPAVFDRTTRTRYEKRTAVVTESATRDAHTRPFVRNRKCRRNGHGTRVLCRTRKPRETRRVRVVQVVQPRDRFARIRIRVARGRRGKRACSPAAYKSYGPARRPVRRVNRRRSSSRFLSRSPRGGGRHEPIVRGVSDNCGSAAAQTYGRVNGRTRRSGSTARRSANWFVRADEQRAGPVGRRGPRRFIASAKCGEVRGGGRPKGRKQQS